MKFLYSSFHREKNLDAHEVDLKDQPIGLGLQGQSNPIVITPNSVITVNVSFQSYLYHFKLS